MTRSRTRLLAPDSHATEAERATNDAKILLPSHPAIHHPNMTYDQRGDSSN